jgi:DNA-directed RNA polymerase specialized sigma24 family protein
MDSIDPAGGLTTACQQLVQIWADPQIKGFARRYARDPQLADDALQSTYYAMARLKHLDEIKNLRAYFCRVLVNQVRRERGQLGAALFEDFASVADVHRGAVDSRFASAAFEDAVCSSVQAGTWHKRLIRKRDELTATVSARSDEPSRYRAVIYEAVEQILRAGIKGEPSEADTNGDFRKSYPEYFDEPGASPHNCHQRFRRARMDVNALLRAVAD